MDWRRECACFVIKMLTLDNREEEEDFNMRVVLWLGKSLDNGIKRQSFGSFSHLGKRENVH